MSPYHAVNLVKEVVGKFLKLYEPPYFPFRSLTARTYELGLVEITGVTGEQFLAQNKVRKETWTMGFVMMSFMTMADHLSLD